MTGFIYKQIHSQKTVAEKLKEKRLQLGLPLENISRLTNISLKYLQAIDQGEFDKIPGEIYLKQWLKKYALILNLNVKEILSDWQKEFKLQLSFNDYQKNIKFKQKRFFFQLTPKVVRNLLISLAIGTFIFYLGWEVKKIIEPPAVVIYEPRNFSVTPENKIIIKGKTDPEVSLWINNQLVLATSKGDFQQEVELLPGLNTFQISAKRKNSQKNNIILSIIKTVANEANEPSFKQNDLGISFKK